MTADLTRILLACPDKTLREALGLVALCATIVAGFCLPALV